MVSLSRGARSGRKETNARANAFPTRAEFIRYLVLDCLRGSVEPLGSWVIQSWLQAAGYRFSVATIGRVLKGLDADGLTEQVNGQGRILTNKGIRYVGRLSETVERAELQRRLMCASQPRDLIELMDLLLARAALERETARLSAMRAGEAEIASIFQALKAHQLSVSENADPTITALDFHKAVAQASQNKFLISALDILIYEELKLESRIARLVTRERGREYVEQHVLIAKAIKERNANEAEHRMAIHMEALLSTIREQMDSMGGESPIR